MKFLSLSLLFPDQAADGCSHAHVNPCQELALIGNLAAPSIERPSNSFVPNFDTPPAKTFLFTRNAELIMYFGYLRTPKWRDDKSVYNN
jgi:hypothetical protein